VSLVNAAQVEMCNVKRDSRRVVRELFREAVREAREATRRHTQREVLTLNVAGRDVGRDAAYYVAGYGYYLSGAVAARSVFYGKVGYAVGLYDDAVVSAAIEGVADRVLVGQEPVRADLRCTDHALAQILDEQVRILSVALAGAVADDCLGRRRHADKRVLIALVRYLMALDALLLLADVAPNLVKLQATGPDTDHHAVMEFGAATTDAGTKAHDGIAVDASDALSGADALAFGEARDDKYLLVAGKNVHDGANPC